VGDNARYGNDAKSGAFCIITQDIKCEQMKKDLPFN
jgi:hypothetical protein